MQKYIDKAAILIEALPYIQRFRNKVVLIKYGGSTMSQEEYSANVLKDVVLMECVGMRPVIVHGGGKAISQRLKERQIEPKFIDGLRVTDEKTMEVVEEVVAELNQEIVEEIEFYGGRACSFCGKGDEIFSVSKKLFSSQDPVTGEKKEADLGYVGEVKKVYTKAVEELLSKDVIPVVAPLGLGTDGHAYNLNADTAAGELAAALEVEKLVYLTNVSGILKDKDDAASLLSTLHVDEVDQLIKERVIEGGMIPKILSGIKSVKNGVHKTHIIDGRLLHSLLLEIFTDKGVGTQIIR